jgi:hypothetical protein
MGARSKYPFVNFSGKDVVSTGTLHFTSVPHTYTDPVIGIGVYGTPITDATSTDNIAFTVNMTTATNKGEADLSCMAAFIGIANTASTPNNKLQGLLASVSVGNDVYDAYAVQGHLTIGAAMTTTNANAHLTGLSGKVKLNGDVEQGWVTGVLAIIEGNDEADHSVTGLCHVIAAQVEANTLADQVDAILFLGADAAVTCAIKIQGASTNIPVLFDFADMGNTGFCVADTTEADVAALRYTLAVKCPDGAVGYIGVMRSS